MLFSASGYICMSFALALTAKWANENHAALWNLSTLSLICNQQKYHALVSAFAVLLGVSIVTMAKFSASSPAAGFLMLPYLGWTCFATTLINCSLWDNNPEVVQSAHNVAQIRPQVNPPTEAPGLAPAASVGHKRNNTWSAGLGQTTQPGSPQRAGQGIVYSSKPIFPRSGSQEHLSSAAQQNNQPSFQGTDTQQRFKGSAQLPPTQQQQHQQPEQQQSQRRLMLQQSSWSHSPSWESSHQQQQQQQQEQQPISTSPFAQAPRDGGEVSAERRATRRTTDDQLAPERFGQLSDSGHLIMPNQDKADRLERATSAGLFAKVQWLLCQRRLPPLYTLQSQHLNTFKGSR